MPAGAVSVAHVLLPTEEVEKVLAQEGFRPESLEDPATFEGRGGFLTVAGVALFASLGGMLFGLDIGYISGIKEMPSFQHDVLGGKEITPSQDSYITMIFGVGAAIAAFPPIINLAVENLGRKGSVICGGCFFCAGAAMQGLAVNLGILMAGRLLAGMSVGLLSANVPVYQSEIAPPHLRGALVSIYQLAITVGIMVAFLVSWLLENVEKPIGGWRWVIFLQLIPGFALGIGGMVMGESPRWLTSKGRAEEALEVLKVVRSSKDDIKMEMAMICKEKQREEEMGEPSWAEFFSGNMRKLLLIGITLQLLQQLCGMNAYMYDGPNIFKRLFNSDKAGFEFTFVSGCVNIVSTLPAIAFVDKAGRCFLLRFSAMGMAICSAVLAVVGAQCFPKEGGDGAGWCGDWSKWVATGAICLFIFNFGYGWGPVVWAYCAEMFPMKYRTKATGATTDANWIGNIGIAYLPPILLAAIGFHTFWVFVGINIVGFLLGVFLPETKDKSLEEIQVMYERWFRSFEEEPSSTSYDEDDDDDSEGMSS